MMLYSMQITTQDSNMESISVFCQILKPNETAINPHILTTNIYINRRPHISME